MEAKQAGAKLAVMDPRLSNTASMADMWLSTYPGTEAAILLAIARQLLEWDAVDHKFIRRWVNWQQTLVDNHPDRTPTYESFIELLKATYAEYTMEYAAEESGVKPEQIMEIAQEIAEAGRQLVLAKHTYDHRIAELLSIVRRKQEEL